MDKYKLGIGDADFLNFWHVLDHFGSEGNNLMTAIEETIADDFDGAYLGKLVTIEDKVKICLAFIRFIADVNPQKLFELAAEAGSGHIGLLIDRTFDTNGTYHADDFISEAAGFGEVIVDVPQDSPNLGSNSFDSNGNYFASDYGFDGFSQVEVIVPEPQGQLDIDSNGTFNVKDVEEVVVNVPEPQGTLNRFVSDGETIDVKNYEFLHIDGILG